MIDRKNYRAVTMIADVDDAGYPWVRATAPAYPDWTGIRTDSRFRDLEEKFTTALIAAIADGSAGDECGEIIFGSHLYVTHVFLPERDQHAP